MLRLGEVAGLQESLRHIATKKQQVERVRERTRAKPERMRSGDYPSRRLSPALCSHCLAATLFSWATQQSKSSRRYDDSTGLSRTCGRSSSHQISKSVTVPSAGHRAGSRGRRTTSTKPPSESPRSTKMPMAPDLGTRTTVPIRHSPIRSRDRTCSHDSSTDIPPSCPIGAMTGDPHGVPRSCDSVQQWLRLPPPGSSPGVPLRPRYPGPRRGIRVRQRPYRERRSEPDQAGHPGQRRRLAAVEQQESSSTHLHEPTNRAPAGGWLAV